MNLKGTAQQRTKHTIRQRHKHTKRHQPQHLARAPSPDSLPKMNDLAHIRPHFSPYSPPYYTYIYCLLCIETNTRHYSPSLLYLYIVSSASTQAPYIILILDPMRYLYIM